MRGWINAGNGTRKDGKSKDGTVTSRGYLAPCDLEFVRSIGLPQNLFDGFKPGMTDRENGMEAERLIARTTKLGYWPNFPDVHQFSQTEQQEGAADFEISPCSTTIEIKADMPGGEYPGTGNLFVQTHEFGHRPNQVIRNGVVTEQHSEFEFHA
jgi:hypothetical protein